MSMSGLRSLVNLSGLSYQRQQHQLPGIVAAVIPARILISLMFTGPALADVRCADGSRPLKLLVHHSDSAYRSGEQGKPAEAGIQRRAWNTPFIVGFGWTPGQAGMTKLIATG